MRLNVRKMSKTIKRIILGLIVLLSASSYGNDVKDDAFKLGQSLNDSLIESIEKEYQYEVNNDISLGEDDYLQIDKNIILNLQNLNEHANASSLKLSESVKDSLELIDTIASFDKKSSDDDKKLILNLIENECFKSKNLDITDNNKFTNIEKRLFCPSSEQFQNSCLIKHDYGANLLTVHGSSLAIRPCLDEKCIEFWIGNKEDNSLDGNCTIFENELSVDINDLKNITAIKITDVYYDDYWQFYMQTNGSDIIKLFSLPNGLFPPETSGECELSESNYINLNTDLLPQIYSLIDNETIKSNKVLINFKHRVSVSGSGEGYAKIKVYYNDLLDYDNYLNLDCINKLLSNNESQNKYQSQSQNKPHSSESTQSLQSNLSFECYKMPAVDEDGCVKDNSLPICLDNFKLPDFLNTNTSQISPLCKEILITLKDKNVSNSNLISGTETSQDININQCSQLKYYDVCEKDSSNPNYYICKKAIKCPQINLSECKEFKFKNIKVLESTLNDIYECYIQTSNQNQKYDSCISFKNANCQMIENECLDDLNNTYNNGNNNGKNHDNEFFTFNSSNNCSFEVFKYQCSKNIQIPKFEEKVLLDCPIDCVGSDCSANITEETHDRTYAISSLEALNYMQDDITCTTYGDDKEPECHVFKGAPSTCRTGYFGKMDCCTCPTDTGIGDYLRLTSYMMSLKTALSAVDSENIQYGSWSNKSLMNSSQGLISSDFDSIIGTITQEPAQFVAQNFKEQLTQKVADFISEIFGEEIKNELFTETAIEGGGSSIEVNSQFASYAQSAMAAYVAYQAFNIAVNIMTSCDKDEVETAVKLNLNSCIHTGRSCSKKVLGKCMVYNQSYCCYNSLFAQVFMKELKRTNQIEDVCSGISIQDFKNIDFSLIDLSEWTSTLLKENLINNKEYSIDSLTGSENVLNTGERMSSDKRTESRVNN